MTMLNVIIDGREVQVPAGSTVLEAAQKAGIERVGLSVRS